MSEVKDNKAGREHDLPVTVCTARSCIAEIALFVLFVIILFFLY